VNKQALDRLLKDSQEDQRALARERLPYDFAAAISLRVGLVAIILLAAHVAIRFFRTLLSASSAYDKCADQLLCAADDDQAACVLSKLDVASTYQVEIPKDILGQVVAATERLVQAGKPLQK
jgi:hypothetical protein